MKNSSEKLLAGRTAEVYYSLKFEHRKILILRSFIIRAMRKNKNSYRNVLGYYMYIWKDSIKHRKDIFI